MITTTLASSWVRSIYMQSTSNNILSIAIGADGRNVGSIYRLGKTPQPTLDRD